MKTMNILTRTFRLVAVVAAFALFAAACSSDDDTSDGLGTLEPSEASDDAETDEPADESTEPEDADEADEADPADQFDLVMDTHQRFLEASDAFLRDGDVDALSEVAAGDAVDDLTDLYGQIEAEGQQVAGFRNAQVQFVNLNSDTDFYGTEFFLVTDCAVDTRRIFDEANTQGELSEDDFTMQWLRIQSAVVIDDDGQARVVGFQDEWDSREEALCIPREQRQRIEEATADLAVATFAGFATNDPADYEDVFEPEWLENYFSRIDDLNRVTGFDAEIGVRLIGADPYRASLVVCLYGFGQTTDATTGEILSGDEQWGDGRTAAEFLVSGVDTGEFRVRVVMHNNMSDYTGWCQIGEVPFTHELNTLSDPSVVPDSPRDNRWARGEAHNS